MKLTLGIAAIALAGALAGCGIPAPSAPVPSPPAPPASATEAPTPTPTPTPEATVTPADTASPTPAGSATPGTSPSASPTPGQSAELNLPDQVDGFMKVEGRTEGDLRIGAYYSDKLKTVVEARATSGKTARDVLSSYGVTDPATVGPALCGGNTDNLCAQEKGGAVVLLTSKELPGSLLADLTTKFLAAMGKN